MRKQFALIAFFVSAMVFAQAADPVIPQHGKDSKAFVPQHWKLISSVEGDLNKDKVKDLVIVIENTSANNIIANNGFGEDILNINPRYLLILFKEKTGYSLQSINKTLIPPPNSAETPCLDDPFDENNVKISKGVITISLKVWLACGSYAISNEKYKLRYQDRQFVLIGYDLWESSRNTGSITETSINFLTGKKSISTGGNLFEDQKKVETQTVWENIGINELITLANLKWPNEIDF